VLLLSAVLGCCDNGASVESAAAAASACDMILLLHLKPHHTAELGFGALLCTCRSAPQRHCSADLPPGRPGQARGQGRCVCTYVDGWCGIGFVIQIGSNSSRSSAVQCAAIRVVRCGAGQFWYISMGWLFCPCPQSTNILSCVVEQVRRLQCTLQVICLWLCCCFVAVAASRRCM
jgi:hypothetical protein